MKNNISIYKKILIIINCALLFVMNNIATLHADDELPIGSIIGKIYSTDIIAYIDGIPIQSYNIGGKTVVILEDIGLERIANELSEQTPTLKKRVSGYTKVGFRTEWYGEERIIKTYISRLQSGTVSTSIGDIEIIDVINKDINGNYSGVSKIYQVENPNNEYSKQYYEYYGSTAIINNLGLRPTKEDADMNFFIVESLLGCIGANYTFKDGVLDIITQSGKQLDIPLKILSYNLYNMESIYTPIYSANVKIAIDGNIIITPDDTFTMIVDDNVPYINIEALETALGIKIFEYMDGYE